MARAYGFRVFVVEAYPNRKKGNKPFTSGIGSGVSQEISLLLSRLSAKGTVRFEPPIDEDGTPTKPVRTATVYPPCVVNPSLIHVRIAVGEEGSHISATRPQSEPWSLRGWSPEAAHEVAFVFPRGAESRFFVVTQTNHRRDPCARLVSMLRNESIALRDERIVLDREAREAARSAGEAVPKAKNFKRLHFDVNQASDDEYLDDLLRGADRASVVFKGIKPGIGGKGVHVDRILQIKLRDENILDVGQRASRSWVKKWRDGESPSQREAVAEMAGLLEERGLLEEGEEERYESTAISVHAKLEGSSTTIAVDSLRDAFTYPISDTSPTVHMFYERLCARLEKIARQDSIEIDPIDPHEVLRCLPDSIQFGS